MYHNSGLSNQIVRSNTWIL